MPIEIAALQLDMFTGELVDARTATQKQRDRERERLQQPFLFSTQTMFQTHGPARPWLKAQPVPVLELAVEDLRTPEEQEMDLIREAQHLTTPLFEAPADETPVVVPAPADEPAVLEEVLTEEFPVEVLLAILLQSSDLLSGDDPWQFVRRMLGWWQTEIRHSTSGQAFSLLALEHWSRWLMHWLDRDEVNPAYSVLKVTKTDLMSVYPELAIAIAGLNKIEMQHLVEQIEVALASFYLPALKVALDRYFERCPF